MNVYEETGKFLFCVRSERNQNGLAVFFLHGTDIYLISRQGTTAHFNENGDYLGGAGDDLQAALEQIDSLPHADEATDGEVRYQAVRNKVYRIDGAQKTIFAQTPLASYCVHSPLFGLLLLLLGSLLQGLPRMICKWKNKRRT